MLLDTNAVSAWAEGEPGFFSGVRHDRPWYLSSIVLGENPLRNLCCATSRTVKCARGDLETPEPSKTVARPDHQPRAQHDASLEMPGASKTVAGGRVSPRANTPGFREKSALTPEGSKNRAHRHEVRLEDGALHLAPIQGARIVSIGFGGGRSFLARPPATLSDASGIQYKSLRRIGWDQ